MHRTDTLNFAPGSQYHYSNSAFVLLGLIVAARVGSAVPEIPARPHLRAAAHGLHGGVREGRESTVPQRAYGYTGDSAGHFTRTDQSSTSATLGDGGIYTSVDDMAKWNDALDHATLVDSAMMREAWSPTMLTTGQESGYGYGWFVATVNGELQLRHHGESTGFTNGILKYPKRKLSIVVLTNRTGGTPWAICDSIAATFPSGSGRLALLPVAVHCKVPRCRAVRSCWPLSAIVPPEVDAGRRHRALLGEERVTIVTTDDYHRYNRRERREHRLSALHPDCNDLDLLGAHLDALASGHPW